MTTIVLLSKDNVLLKQLQSAFAIHAPHLHAVLAEDPGANDAVVAACWYPPEGSLSRLPNLRLLHSVAAGVDHLSTDPSGHALPVCRVVDPDHRRGMTEYIRWTVLHYHRDFDRAIAQQQNRQWQRHSQRSAGQFKIGVMGLGSLGASIAADLTGAGYDVRGWSRSERWLHGVACYHGNNQFDTFLNGLDVLVNLLPLTEVTRGILNRTTFARLGHGAVVVNGGRGQHLMIDDLELALASGQLRGAVLDVFEHEPLPVEHPLWQMAGVVITPHMASAASHECIVSQIKENTQRLLDGDVLHNLVSPSLGY
ncbi:glyoxylate/hydroxypyruvate reductase A [Pseudomonas syringae]|uniref:2-hydroxyacid dehydrogenase n=1 Tax=Pseudomonas syringae TaxID=317 RepID=UPI001F3E350A|nr:glyoxylate/hydroxypyruvate reductase A [Pseudomonas syringae]MCF8984593.1 glyoxylate/hydroxypyruvate reductase A [Pseudomonas syringae]MCF9004965.1 glyoxylate/hydroxypyruvate reductase A [Pseudomonas syringae]